MKIAFYDTHLYEKDVFEEANKDFQFEITYFDFKLSDKTARTAEGFDAVCAFVNDTINEKCLRLLKLNGIKLILMRCAGLNNVDLKAAKKFGIEVASVPAYSPSSIAEYAVAMLLALVRKIPQSYERTRNGDFSLDGLIGTELNGLTAGIIGTGKIGKYLAKILKGFGMRILLYDIVPDTSWAKENNLEYVSLITLLEESDVISLHCPLTSETKQIINAGSLSLMRRKPILINTSRGGLVDTVALINALKQKLISGAVLDVYEEESKYFYTDWSQNIITDDVLSRLLTFPNVIITSHQAFLTNRALSEIAFVTLRNAQDLVEERN